jgi:phage-related tail protein
MKELQEKRKEKFDNLKNEIVGMKQIEHNIENLNKEKEDFSVLQKTLTQENQDLKQKFSDLLDQFQEYVNESETRMEEERGQQKIEQANLLNDLNSTIAELEEMSKTL